MLVLMAREVLPSLVCPSSIPVKGEPPCLPGHTATPSAPLSLLFPASVSLLLLALRSGCKKDKAEELTSNRS